MLERSGRRDSSNARAWPSADTQSELKSGGIERSQTRQHALPCARAAAHIAAPAQLACRLSRPAPVAGTTVLKTACSLLLSAFQCSGVCPTDFIAKKWITLPGAATTWLN